MRLPTPLTWQQWKLWSLANELVLTRAEALKHMEETRKKPK